MLTISPPILRASSNAIAPLPDAVTPRTRIMSKPRFNDNYHFPAFLTPQTCYNTTVFWINRQQVW
jgi:hypothetical protein